MLWNVRLCAAEWWIQIRRSIFLLRRKSLIFFLNKLTLVLLDNSSVLEGTSAAKNTPSGTAVRRTENESEPEELSEGCVLEALEKTSKVIQDIESLLAASRKWSLAACEDLCSVPSQEALRCKRHGRWRQSGTLPVWYPRQSLTSYGYSTAVVDCGQAKRTGEILEDGCTNM